MSATPPTPRPRRPGRRRAAGAGHAAPYDFPTVAEHRLDNGLRILVADLPGRPLVSASLVLAERRRRRAGRRGRRDRPRGPRPVRGHRALRRDRAVEASERLGASLHAEAGWDALLGRRRRARRPARRRRWSCRRGRPPADLPGRRGRAAPRRAAQRPPPGEGRPAPARRGGLRRRRSTRRRRRTTARPAGPARPSRG